MSETKKTYVSSSTFLDESPNAPQNDQKISSGNSKNPSKTLPSELPANTNDISFGQDTRPMNSFLNSSSEIRDFNTLGNSNNPNKFFNEDTQDVVNPTNLSVFNSSVDIGYRNSLDQTANAPTKDSSLNTTYNKYVGLSPALAPGSKFDLTSGPSIGNQFLGLNSDYNLSNVSEFSSIHSQQIQRSESYNIYQEQSPNFDFLSVNRAKNRLNAFSPSPTNNLKGNSILSSAKTLNLGTRDSSFIKSVPASRRTSPEMSEMWDSFNAFSINQPSKTSQHLASTTTKIKNQNSLYNIDLLLKAKESSAGNVISPTNDPSSNTLSSQSGKPFDFTSQRPLNSNGSSINFANISDHTKVDRDFSTNTANTDYDPQLPLGLLEDDEGLYIKHKKSPVNLELAANRNELLGIKRTASTFGIASGSTSANTGLHSESTFFKYNNDIDYDQSNDTGMLSNFAHGLSLGTSNQNYNLSLGAPAGSEFTQYSQKPQTFNNASNQGQFQDHLYNQNTQMQNPNNMYNQGENISFGQNFGVGLQSNLNIHPTMDGSHQFIGNYQSQRGKPSVLPSNAAVPVTNSSTTEPQAFQQPSSKNLPSGSNQSSADPNLPHLSHQQPDLVRNYSMPTLNSNTQHSLLQQHYQELSKLLNFGNDRSANTSPKHSQNNAINTGPGLAAVGAGKNTGNLTSLENNTGSVSTSGNNPKNNYSVNNTGGNTNPNTANYNTSSVGTNGSSPNFGDNSDNFSSPSDTTKLGVSEFSRNNSNSNLQSMNSSVHRRKHDVDNNKYSNVRLDELEGRLYSVCKDQYGCRYLQKQLEEGSEDHIEMIFKEITPHFSKLMADPFGNYLCQKLFEHCNEKQRTSIIKLISNDLVSISLNIHGTRAVQKLIDLLTTQPQIDCIIEALKDSVVVLIRDLNGNHVIQKCLNRLVSGTGEGDDTDGIKNSNNVQFIYNSVANNCIEVATHRHGCCVFQRCIDVASSAQLSQLVNKVTENALILVQDPFGNYVVQYIFDLNKPEINDMMISKFITNFAKLSKQKFSSNVMEKSFKIANKEMQNMIVKSILQLMNQNHLLVLADLISDSFGNYVVQTILDHLIDINVKYQLIEAIKLIQNNIKLTPYGKRIINKLYRDGFVSNINSTCPSNNNSRIPSPVLNNNQRMRHYQPPQPHIHQQQINPHNGSNTNINTGSQLNGLSQHQQQVQYHQQFHHLGVTTSASTPNLLGQQHTGGNLMYNIPHDFHNGMVNNGATGPVNSGFQNQQQYFANNINQHPQYIMYNNPGFTNALQLGNISNEKSSGAYTNNGIGN
ncbi:hypothetical protein BB559_005722 [Furculomyces boomerangus]|uniref:PUM-HD domain-containing protein n=1 Tax=Furculomyces boomerangus TaxID=61424 RepID=A0A2T9Y6Y7_9FUNG|nr:hypothetical protein BB559_005722 [Furculomyces boomerangus]